MDAQVKDVAVVIRCCGERTFEACRKITLKQIPESALHVVNERPFEKALRRTYETGIHSGAKWTMTLDADVLLQAHSVERLVAEANAMPEHFIQLEGLVHDKLTGLYRQAGHRIYRTRFLEKALLEIPSTGTEIRPEFETLERMKGLGFPSRRVDLVVGIHDYEQYYRDIYRKAFVHANKHQIWLGDLVTRWKRLMADDADFRVALRGLYDGLMSFDTPKIDVDEYSSVSMTAVQELNLGEKRELDETITDPDFVSRMLGDAGRPPEFPADAKRNISQKFKDHYRRIGTLRMIPFLAGAVFCRIGESLRKVGDIPVHQ